VFTVVGGAQAADLTVAEPVDYVQVCDAFGTGYWYIPGTTTCINIGGEVTFDINIHNSKNVMSGDYTEYETLGTGTGYAGDFDDDYSGQSNHSAGWDFVTGAKVSVTAKSATEYGDLVAYIKMKASSNNSSETQYVANAGVLHGPGYDQTLYFDKAYMRDMNFGIDKAYLMLGGFKAGYDTSIFDPGGGYIGSATREDIKTDALSFSFAMGGYGLKFAVEDPRDRWGTLLPASYSMPDITAALTASQGNWNAQLSAGFSQIANLPSYSSSMTVYGVDGMIEFKPGPFSLKLNAAVGTGSKFVGGGTNGVTNWSAYASAKVPLASTLDLAGLVNYLHNGNGSNTWSGAAGLIWKPVSEFSVEGRVTWAQGGVWGGRVELKRTFGAD
jgi:hypothetical protein